METLQFWIRAFIPSTVLPDAVGRCFENDQRLFSNAQLAEARVVTEGEIIVEGATAKLSKLNGREYYQAGLTRQVDCATRIPIESKRADVSGLKFGQIAFNNQTAQLAFSASVANPITPPVLSPKIDYDVTLKWDVQKREVTFAVTTGRFPAFEGYVSANGKAPITLFQVAPDANASPFELYDFGLGVNQRRFTGTVKTS